MEWFCGDRIRRTQCVRERLKHLNKWEQQQGHKCVWERREHRVERNDGGVINLECSYEGSGKVC